jgi:hypothetical protein
MWRAASLARIAALQSVDRKEKQMKHSLIPPLGALIAIAGCGYGVTTYGGRPDVDNDPPPGPILLADDDDDSSPTDDDDSATTDDDDSDAVGDDDDTLPDEPEEPEEPVPLVDFGQRGPHTVVAESNTTTVTNCTSFEYTVYSPDGVTDPEVVVLGHGFARGPGVMVGWADHFASWGLEVLLPTLCHYNVLAGVDHEMNGQNMVELAGLHGATDPTYAGHSAGGLAALIASSMDPDSRGVLGLDTTDTEDAPGVPDFIGQSYAPSAFPGYLLIGEPSTCNAENNGVPLFQLMGTFDILKLTGADHCDFESPTDFMCTFNCENATIEFPDEDIRPAVLTLGTAAVMALTETHPDGEMVWAIQGTEEWANIGLVQEL